MRWIAADRGKLAGSGGQPASGLDPQNLLKWVYFGRVAVAIVVFGAAAFSFDDVLPQTIVILAAAALATVLMSAWSAWYTHVSQRPVTTTFLYLQALFDLALVTTVVHVTQGPASEFPALYILVIAVSAVLMPFASSLLVTALASLLYVGDIIVWQRVPLTATVWVQLAVFVGVSVVTGLITSRVRAARAQSEELEREVHRLRLEAADILRNIRSGVLTVDGEGTLAYANEAALELLGLTSTDVLHVPLATLLEVRSPALANAIVQTQQRRVKTLRAEGFVSLPDRTYPIGVTTTTLDMKTRGESSVTAIFTDISDQKRIEELRLRTERLEAVAELSASLAHEIKNPLASIRSSVEQLASSARANDDERSLAQLVVRESDRLSELLSEFLDFSRIEGDEDLIHRIVVNLVLNAVQASNGTAKIQVEVRETVPGELPKGFQMDNAVVLKVLDNGPGIPEELRERLFEPFVTGRVGGSGLGLAIVQRAVQAHRGAVFVDSAPHEGTAFTVFLPKKATTEVAA
ncbi:MAG: ATP-binding protein [Gemmatimonadales bacterium]